MNKVAGHAFGAEIGYASALGCNSTVGEGDACPTHGAARVGGERV